MRAGIFLWAFLLTGLAPPAGAQECPRPPLIATVPLGRLAPGSDVRTVPVALNGAQRQMILDTGGAITQVSRATVQELQLPLRPSSAQVFDIAGNISGDFTLVKDFAFATLHRNDAALMVWPHGDAAIGGELAQDMLQPFDIEMDFGAGVLRLYARDHCPGTPGWQEPSAIRLPMANQGWHLHIPVTLEGHDYDAIFDTGSSVSMLRLPVARRDFGLSPQSPGMTAVPDINGDASLTGYLHAFSRMTLGSQTIDGPQILIVPDLMNRHADRSPMTGNRALRHNDRLVLPDLTVGMDVLKRFRLYVAFGEGALYIAPARQTSAAPFPSTPARD